MFWTRDSATLTPVTRPGLSLDTQRGRGAASSLLHLASLRAEDAGRYSCHSDLATPASVRVIVASGDSAVAALLQCCEQKRPCRPHHA